MQVPRHCHEQWEGASLELEKFKPVLVPSRDDGSVALLADEHVLGGKRISRILCKRGESFKAWHSLLKLDDKPGK